MRLHVPDAPFGLVRDWTQRAYEDLCRRRPWNFLRVQGQLVIPAARTVTVTFTLASTTATSAAGFLATDLGRQLRVAASLPFYTILAVVDASTVTLDMPYTGTSGAVSTTLLQVYQTLPVDFGAFLLVVDVANQRQIGWWYTQEEIARLDVARTSSDGLPRALVTHGLSTVPATLGQAVYEWWPSSTTARAYPYWYRQQAQKLSDLAPLLGVVTAGVLEAGALAKCALWPGTAERKNPYFNLGLGKSLQDQFDHECHTLELRDDDQAQESWVALPFHRWPVWDLGMSMGTLRASDASAADYHYF